MALMRGDDGHEAVSNLIDEKTEEKATVAETLTQEPGEGTGQLASAVMLPAPSDEMEEVPGYTRTQELTAGVWAAPTTEMLRDVAEASFGAQPDRAEIVHGPDDRVQITNTSVYPWRAHASLLITARDGSLWIGTGWFIGPHTLATAGHVVYIRNSGVAGRDGWVRSIQVMPGRNGATLPYGSVTSTNFRTVSGYINSGDEAYDYGAIIIPTELGNTTGWFGFGAWPDAELTAATANISGYPGDKPAGTQWYDARRVASVGPRKVYYDVDTAGGQSGSAVYRIINGSRYGIAVHAYGGATTNSGTRIVTAVFNNLVAWKA